MLPCTDFVVFIVLTIFHRYYYYFPFDLKVCVLKPKTGGGKRREEKTIQSSDSIASLRALFGKQNSPPGSGVTHALGVVAPDARLPRDQESSRARLLKGPGGFPPGGPPHPLPQQALVSKL